MQSCAPGNKGEHRNTPLTLFDSPAASPCCPSLLPFSGQLASTYLDAYLATGDVAFADVARGVLDYLRRDMTAPQGGILRRAGVLGPASLLSR